MSIKSWLHDLKVWHRSGSWEFARSKDVAADPAAVNQMQWNGIPLYYRPGTTDQGCIYEILLRPAQKREYQLPDWLEPKVILDIGGNIGITAVYLAWRFPKATVYTFEPVPTNFAVLQKNVSTLRNVKAFPFGLGTQSGEFDIYASEDSLNLGGFSLYGRANDGINAGVDLSRATRVEIRRTADVLAEQGVECVDVIKVDTEGAEYDALTSIEESMLSRVQWIMGELHGRRDFELLAHLSPWFDVKVNKRLESELFLFYARNKTLHHVGANAN
jgi:FkbM family methyltransferase